MQELSLSSMLSKVTIWVLESPFSMLTQKEKRNKDKANQNKLQNKILLRNLKSLKANQLNNKKQKNLSQPNNNPKNSNLNLPQLPHLSKRPLHKKVQKEKKLVNLFQDFDKELLKD